MAKDRPSSKFAVILHADIAGSTSLVQQDEQLAHERIQDAFRRFTETIQTYQGHILELRGDALLAEFERPSDAVAATLAFQTDHTYLISRLKDEIRPALRVGIAMGEVVIADNTVTGAGVVLAQRVEQLADPGGVCITAALHEALPKRMPFDLENIGEQVLKGFDDPVRVFRVELSAGQSIPLPQKASKSETSPKKPRLMVATIVIVLIVAGGATYWFKTQEPKIEAASIDRMAFPLPDKPSIAVLPFVNMSNDTEQEYFVDGLTEDLITDISKVSGLFVIARNSVFTYKGKAVKVRQVAEELGVRYVLEGSVRRAGNQVRINAQLIDATTGGHVWAERYDGKLTDVFNLQDNITKQILDALALELTPQEAQHMSNPGTEIIEAYDAYLLGLSFYYRRTPESFVKAIAHFERAIELDPDYALASVAIAKIFAQAGRIHTYTSALSVNRRDVAAKARAALKKAQTQPLADINVVRSWLALHRHQKKRAIAEAEKALELNPNNIDALEALALALIYAGQPESGIELIKKAMRQNPTFLARPLMFLGLAEFARGKPNVAVDHIKRAFELGSEEILYAGILAAAYGEIGDIDKARQRAEIIGGKGLVHSRRRGICAAGRYK
jgi:TolB-like protein/class 3 adenylate cyclase/Flp pilus assembly protein TadD